MISTSLPRLSYRKLGEEIYETLKQRILSQQFAPGKRLDLAEIERQMGVSRTPLNEALSRLAAEGLVETRHRRGTFVTDPAPIEMAQAFDVRRILEVYAVELAVASATEPELERLRRMVRDLRRLMESNNWVGIYQQYVALDHDLHELIVNLAGNRPLKEAWNRVNVHVHMARVRFGSAEEQLGDAQEEHEAILRAFEAKDAEALKEAMAHHIERAKRSLLRDVEKQDHVLRRKEAL